MTLEYILMKQSEWGMEEAIVSHVLITLYFGVNTEGFQLECIQVSIQRIIGISFSKGILSLVVSVQVNSPLTGSVFRVRIFTSIISLGLTSQLCTCSIDLGSLQTENVLYLVVTVLTSPELIAEI